jgi:hypothetical protein
VAQAYLDLLGRAVDPAGLTAWSAALSAGATRAAVVQALIGSTEYRARQIEGLFLKLLDRPIDGAGLTAFENEMNAGTSLLGVEQQIVASTEYFSVQGGTFTTFAIGVYRDLLGRAPDGAGEGALIEGLRLGGTRDAAVAGILHSAEFEGDLVRGIFGQYLRRPADAGALSYYVGQLAKGGTEEQLLVSVVGSDEYDVSGVARNGSPTEKYVAKLYEDVLGRSVDAAALGMWTAKLDLGGNRADVVTALLNSPEYFAKYVNGQYQAILGRPADGGGLAAMAQTMTNGSSEGQVTAALAGSAEFYADAGGTTAGFLGRLYQDLLGRGLDAAGLNAFGPALDQGASRTSVALALEGSVEFRTKLVQGFYTKYLKRGADAGGLGYALGQLSVGGTTRGVLEGILESQEYFNGS